MKGTTNGFWPFQKIESYEYPFAYDFGAGADGFNSTHGSGARVAGFFGGQESIDSASALVINTPEHVEGIDGVGISARFEGLPVFVNRGTSDEVRRYQYDVETGKGSCSFHPGGQQC